MGLQADIPGLAIAGCVVSGLPALVHIFIFVFESMLWRKRPAKAFSFPQATVDASTVLAANQGFYNLLLAVGLIWGIAELSHHVLLYFNDAVCTAGVFGAITSSPRILFVQVIPGALGFLFVAFGFLPKSDWALWRHPLYLSLILVGACVATAILTVAIKMIFLKAIPIAPSQTVPSEDEL